MRDTPAPPDSGNPGLRGRLRFLPAVAFWAVFAAEAAWLAHDCWYHRVAGLDLRPMYRAGLAATHGTSIYDVPYFVYPPPAAVAAVPLTAVGFRTDYAGMIALELLVVAVLGTWLARWFVRAPRHRFLAAAGAFSVLILFSQVSRGSIWLGNLSVLLAPAVPGLAVLFGRGRWRAGSGLLVGTLLLKPLLLPVVLIPVLARRTRTLLVAGAAGVVVLLACSAALSGLGELPHVVRLLARGSVLVGRLAPNNLSLSGFGEVHHLPAWLTLLARGTVVLVAVAVCLALGRRGGALLCSGPDHEAVPVLACLTAVLLLALFLAGSLSEVHYLFLVLPGSCAALLVHRSRLVLGTVGLGLLALMYPRDGGGRVLHQGLFVFAEVAFFVAGAIALLAVSRTGATTSGDRADGDTGGARRSPTRHTALV